MLFQILLVVLFTYPCIWAMESKSASSMATTVPTKLSALSPDAQDAVAQHIVEKLPQELKSEVGRFLRPEIFGCTPSQYVQKFGVGSQQSIYSYGAARYNHDSTQFVTANEGMLTLWNAENGTPLKHLSGGRDHICDVAFNHAGSELAALDTSENIRAWNLGTGMMLWQRNAGSDGGSVQYSSDDRYLFDKNRYGKIVKEYNSETGVVEKEIASLRIVSHGRVGDDNGCLLIRDAVTGRCVVLQDVVSEYACRAEYDRTCKRVIVSNASCFSDESSTSIYAVKEIPDDQESLCLKKIDGNAKGYKLIEQHPEEVIGIRVSGRRGDRLELWDIQKLACILRLENSGTVRSAEYNHDHSQVLTADDYLVKIWDVRSGQYLQELVGGAQCAEYSRDGKNILTLKVWPVQVWPVVGDHVGIVWEKVFDRLDPAQVELLLHIAQNRALFEKRAKDKNQQLSLQALLKGAVKVRGAQEDNAHMLKEWLATFKTFSSLEQKEIMKKYCLIAENSLGKHKRDDEVEEKVQSDAKRASNS